MGQQKLLLLILGINVIGFAIVIFILIKIMSFISNASQTLEVINSVAKEFTGTSSNVHKTSERVMIKDYINDKDNIKDTLQ